MLDREQIEGFVGGPPDAPPKPTPAPEAADKAATPTLPALRLLRQWLTPPLAKGD